MLNKKVMGAASGATPSATDPDFEYVTMLLHGDGTNGAQNNTFVSTPVPAPSGGFFAGYFDGNGDYLTCASNTAFEFGTGQYTVEFWIYFNAVENINEFISTSNDSSSGRWCIYYNSGSIQVVRTGGGGATTYAWTPIVGRWYHIAASRDASNNQRLFLDGALVATATSTNAYAQSGFRVGWSPFATGPYLNGYVSNIRIVKGTAVYTANFTPPSGPLAAIANTSLLTCNNGFASNFTDLSTNNFTITANGNAVVTGVSTAPPGTLPYSGYFDGSGDFLTVPSNTALAFGTGDFTAECWVYKISTGTVAIMDYNGLGGFGFVITSTQITCFITQSTSYAATATVALNTWAHIAFARSGTTLKTYLNGVEVGSFTVSYNFTSPATLTIGRNAGSGQEQLNGYISNLRLVKGTAVYTSNFAPPNAPLTAISGTSLLTCQSSTFVDNSPNAFTISVAGNTSVQSSEILPAVTRNGNTTQGSLNPFGDRWSNYFDGAGDYLTLPTSTGLTMGTGAFTLEAWVWFSSTTQGGVISGLYDNSTTLRGVGIYVLSGVLYFQAGTNSIYNWTLTSSAFNTNQWNHVVGVRDASGNFGFFINGSRVGSGTNNVDLTVNSFVVASRFYDNPTRSPLTGYLSNVRVVKGAAVYNPTLTTLTVPTAPLTAIANTQLLTCQGNRFRDASSNNFTITRNGDVSVTSFSPFIPSAAYSTSTNGGSAYFDGTGDYLSIPASSSLTLSGDYTLEAWIYPFDVSTAYKRLFQNVPGTTPSGFYYVYLWGTQVRMYNADNTALGTNLGEFVPRAWFHLAICRSGSTTRIFINGSQTSTITGSTTFTNNGWFVGGGPSSEFNNVYVSSHRLVVGSAIYTSNFTPPTAPPTAITNTALLLNFTNAGIFDNAADNVLETVGNAQISTSIKKYGTGSLAFDGTGDYLVPYADIEAFAFGSGNFTIEFWVYLNSTQTAIFYDGRPVGGAGATPTIYVSSNTLYYFTNNANVITGPTLSNTTWYHIAVCKSGSSTKMFVDGTQVGSTYTDNVTYVNSTGRPIIGASGNTINQFPLNGYIDDFRITKGVARYTANFTPPTAAFPDL